MLRTAAKVDVNQPTIVKALRAIGATVLHTHQLTSKKPTSNWPSTSTIITIPSACTLLWATASRSQSNSTTVSTYLSFVSTGTRPPHFLRVHSYPTTSTFLAQRGEADDEGANLYHIASDGRGYFVGVDIDYSQEQPVVLRSFVSSIWRIPSYSSRACLQHPNKPETEHCTLTHAHTKLKKALCGVQGAF